MKVKSAKVFSVLDLQNGCFHLPVKHNDHNKLLSFYQGTSINGKGYHYGY